MMDVSDKGVAFIAGWEGLRLAFYRDVVGVWTIGYGHAYPGVASLDDAGARLTRDLAAAGLGAPSRDHSPTAIAVTAEQATGLLRIDLRTAARGVSAAFPGIGFLQPQFDALVSFAFNLGVGMLGRGHTLGDAIRANDYAGAAAAFVLYDHAGGVENTGLRNRRLAERDMFLDTFRDFQSEA
jgi:lysozyme